MKFQVKRVAGAQAEDAARLGLVKITASSAEHLFDLGIPFYIVGNNVNSYHFFDGFHLAMPVNSEEFISEGRSFHAYPVAAQGLRAQLGQFTGQNHGSVSDPAVGRA